MAGLDDLLGLYFDGDLDASFAFGGQVAGRIDEVKPVAEIIDETIAEFHEILHEAARYPAPTTARDCAEEPELTSGMRPSTLAGAMARDATDTRETLLRTAQQMFARDGIHQVPLKRIVETAGQRNASALHYHFGGRDGLLVAITERHDGAIEDERAELLSELAEAGKLDDLRALVEALVVPFAHKLATPDGREYLRIVEQLVGLFDLWDVEVAGGPTGAQQVLLHIQSRLDASAAAGAPRAGHDPARAGVRDPGHAGPCARGRPGAGARSRRVRRQPRRHGRRRAVGAGLRRDRNPAVRRRSRAARRQGRARHRGRGNGDRVRDREALSGRGRAGRDQRQARATARRVGRRARCSGHPVRRHAGRRRAGVVRRGGVGARRRSTCS